MRGSIYPNLLSPTPHNIPMKYCVRDVANVISRCLLQGFMCQVGSSGQGQPGPRELMLGASHSISGVVHHRDQVGLWQHQTYDQWARSCCLSNATCTIPWHLFTQSVVQPVCLGMLLIIHSHQNLHCCGASVAENGCQFSSCSSWSKLRNDKIICKICDILNTMKHIKKIAIWI